MDLLNRQLFQISEASAIYGTRTAICKAASQLGFDENSVSEIAIVVNELSTNLIKHCKTGGSIIMQSIVSKQVVRLDLVSISDPPGMRNPEHYLRDGASTASTLGTGLGAIQRLSDHFDLYSSVTGGTAIGASFQKRSSGTDTTDFDVGGISLPKDGEIACGDQYSFVENLGKLSLLVVDGLGHGIEAAKAARRANEVFLQNRSNAPDELINSIHEQLHQTRGAAVAVAMIDRINGTCDFCGLGNIAGAIETGHHKQSLLSVNGTAGYEARNIRVRRGTWASDSRLLMHSDGLCTNWSLENYKGIFAKSSLLAAALLVRDHRKKFDDCTVVVVKEKTHGS
ncbi:MAG: SpoIIE family protein phosphatase [Candidatus Obscuribacterales bacterium]|nr:SpoIIE family protein phosphatase [Candidatus Obscuribacterales bacterium]